MALERTLALIKPDAFKAHNAGNIIAMIEKAGFSLIHIQLLKMTDKSARQFYSVHSEKGWFDELIEFMTSDKIVAMVLEKENAISAWRDLMGATDPKKAEKGSVRAAYGTEIPFNATHGSDSPENAKIEITYLFGEFAAIPSSEKENAKEY